MNQEIKSLVKKTAKVAGVTCFALGGAALIASGAAVKALTLGAQYLRDTVKEILEEEPKAEEGIVDAAQEVPAEVVAEEADFVAEA